MAQNIYDNPAFFSGYSQLPRQVKGLDGAPEWPAIRAILPALEGRTIADLGCGFGWAARWMRTQGAAGVHGYDLSENMIARAKADTADPAITYHIADLETSTCRRPASISSTARSPSTMSRTFTGLRRPSHLRSSTAAIWSSPSSTRSSWRRATPTGSPMKTAARLGR